MLVTTDFREIKMGIYPPHDISSQQVHYLIGISGTLQLENDPNRFVSALRSKSGDFYRALPLNLSAGRRV
ncbi:MAG: hypothetical protein RL386_1912 [Bacteroidota bacterium]